MKKKLPFTYNIYKSTFFSLLFLSVFLPLKSQILTQTFTYNGATQTFVVPPCVYTMTMETWGAQGGANWTSNTNYGGYAKGVFAVVPGSTLIVSVGGQPTNTLGGFNGGGNGEALGQGGGGASDVRSGGNGLTNRILVAGGGGGAGYWSGLHVVGGIGGGLAGGDGYRNTTADPGGQGGTQSGTGLGTCVTLNNSSVSGGLGFGGSSTGCGCEGYGGGGGYYGGAGSGNCRGGGGGSGYILSTATNTVFTSGITVGHGKVLFTYAAGGGGISPSATSYSFCSGTTVTLSASGVPSYTWNPGGSNATSISVTPTGNTSYTVQGTNTLNCIVSSVFNLTVDPGLPALTIVNTASATGGICPTKTVMLTAGGASAYSWTGGPVSVTNGVLFSPPASGTYIVTGTNACGTSTAATSVSVHPLPGLTPVASTQTLCAGSSVTLTGVGSGPSTPTAYAWSGGAGGITNGVGFTPALTATYTVVGTSALSCTASAAIAVTVFASPNVPPTAQPVLICIGNSSTLTATGATSYTWMSSTQTVTTPTLLATPGATGISTYTVLRANSTCTTSQVISVVTNSLPSIFAFVQPTLVCALNPASISIGGGQTYTWTSPGNPPISPSFTFSGSNPVVYPPVPTTYSVAASDGTCINVTTVSVAVDPNPTITTSASTPSICNGQSVTISATGGINYTWTSTSSATTTVAQSFADYPVSPTSYNVIGDNSFGCISSAGQIVLVYQNPTLTAIPTKTLVCSSGPSTITANGADTYLWIHNSAPTKTTLVNPTNTVSGPVEFTVTGTYSATGCQSSKTASVMVFVPMITVTGNTNTCFGGLVNLTALAGPGTSGSYKWYTTVGGPSYNFATMSTSVTAPTVFTVTAMTTSLTVNCPSTKTVDIGIYFNPTITAVAQRTTICVKESVVLTATGGVTYVWSNNSQQTQTILVTPNSNASYTVTGTDANGCVNAGTVSVKVSGCVGINELNATNSGLIIYPNPNNGAFIIQSGSDAKLTLINELGQVVRTFTLSGSNNYNVSVSDLAKGIYFITGQQQNTAINVKVLVTK